MGKKFLFFFICLILNCSKIDKEKIISYSNSEFAKIIPYKEIILKIEDSNFHFSGIYKLEKDKLFLAIDSKNFKIILFDTEGNLVFKIGERGKSPGNFEMISQIAFDSNRNILYILDPMLSRLSTFLIMNKQIKFKKIVNFSFSPHSVSIYNNNLIVSLIDFSGGYQFIEYDIELNAVNKYIKQSPIKNTDKDLYKRVAYIAGDDDLLYTIWPFESKITTYSKEEDSKELKQINNFITTIKGGLNKHELGMMLEGMTGVFITKKYLLHTYTKGNKYEVYDKDTLKHLGFFLINKDEKKQYIGYFNEEFNELIYVDGNKIILCSIKINT